MRNTALERSFLCLSARCVRALSLDAAEEIAERLREQPHGIKTKELLEVVTMGLDRTGHGPRTSTDHTHHHVLSREDIDELKRGADEGNRRRTIDITPIGGEASGGEDETTPDAQGVSTSGTEEGGGPSDGGGDKWPSAEGGQGDAKGKAQGEESPGENV